jgi:hypothetical protein
MTDFIFSNGDDRIQVNGLRVEAVTIFLCPLKHLIELLSDIIEALHLRRGGDVERSDREFNFFEMVKEIRCSILVDEVRERDRERRTIVAPLDETRIRIIIIITVFLFIINNDFNGFLAASRFHPFTFVCISWRQDIDTTTTTSSIHNLAFTPRLFFLFIFPLRLYDFKLIRVNTTRIDRWYESGIQHGFTR